MRETYIAVLRAAAIANFSQASRFFQALKELGCKFALDDFGTAEFIEVLRGLGVDYAQGNGVSQPQKVQRAAIA